MGQALIKASQSKVEQKKEPTHGTKFTPIEGRLQGLLQVKLACPVHKLEIVDFIEIIGP